MALTLTAFFAYTAAGLSASFRDLSYGNPSSWSWDFGDGTSTVQNPTHTFSEEGFHTVTLSITSGLVSTTITQRVGVSNSGFECPQMPTYDSVVARIPPAVLLLLNPSLIYAHIRKWQNIIGMLVDPKINPIYTHNELYWPILANELVIELVSIDIFEGKLKEYLMISASNASGQGSLKKVVTGPTEAEWSTAGELFKDMGKSGGLIDQYKSEACSLASMLKVPLAICPELNKVIFAPTIAKLR